MGPLQLRHPPGKRQKSASSFAQDVILPLNFVLPVGLVSCPLRSNSAVQDRVLMEDSSIFFISSFSQFFYILSLFFSISEMFVITSEIFMLSTLFFSLGI